MKLEKRVYLYFHARAIDKVRLSKQVKKIISIGLFAMQLNGFYQSRCV